MVEGLQVQEGISFFCTIVLMSDLLVFVIDAREAKRNELSSFLEGTKNQVGEIDIKLCLFHFNYCHFEKGPFQ